MKKAFLFCILFLLCLALTGCADHLSKSDIFALVREKEAFLLRCVAEDQPDQATQLAGVRYVYRASGGAYIRFDCGGAGFGPATSYYGFYYSPGDLPLTVNVDVTQTENLVPDGDGFLWMERWADPGGDNVYYTERIMERWYYFESHY
ncbi:MAG: hypothetical protein IJS53_02445 [Clostridia bacterium]|nr:hypothetical protein [Clostridia bacterium]